jgi:hypothetical protein
VILDIIQPNMPKLQRFLTIVETVNEDSSNIVVHKSSNDIGGLYNGARFNIHVKNKGSDRWNIVKLRVIDENYDDGLDFSFPNQTEPIKLHRELSRKSSFIPSIQDVFTYSMPSNYTDSGEPYFAPPIHIPPIPVGYNECHLPYYGKTPSSRAHPVGINLSGQRYYSHETKRGLGDPNHINQLAGYDSDGNPFYTPRGFVLPPPSGFSVDGIPYYDIPSLMRQQGIFVLPSLLRGDNRTANETDKWEDLLIYLQNSNEEDVLLQRRLEALFLSKLTNQLNLSNTSLAKRLNLSRGRLVNPFQTKNGSLGPGVFVPSDEFSTVRDPVEVTSFLRESISFSHLRPQPIKIFLEPGSCDFHSSRTPTSKTLSLRFKAGRGDHTEREYFLAVEPPNIFKIKDFSFKLQGEGIHEILVTYYPLAMKENASTEGGLHVFDKFGRKMASSKLNAAKRKFIKIHNTTLDIGWTMIGKKKESFIIIENLAEYQIIVTIQPPKTNIVESSGVAKESAFYSTLEVVKLKPFETSKIPVIFQPKCSINASDTMKLFGPGGEEVAIQLIGTTNIPMAIYAENQIDSELGVANLSIERTQLMKKVQKRVGITDLTNNRLTISEQSIINKITTDIIDGADEIAAHTVDFGVSSIDNPPCRRCITIFNWGEESIICGMYSHENCIECPIMVKIAPKSARTVEVIFDFNTLKRPIRGNFTSVIEISSQSFKNIPIRTKAFIGQPIYLPNWSYIFFKPCRLNQTITINTTIINESQYNIKFRIKGLDPVNEPCGFKSSQITSNDTCLDVAEYALIPISFTFTPIKVGPKQTNISLSVVFPNEQSYPAGINSKEIILVGICIQPRLANLDLKIHPAIDKLVKWFNQSISPVLIPPSEYNFEDTNDDFEEIPIETISDVVFKSDPFMPETAGDFSTKGQTLAVQNRGSFTKKVKFMSSLGFTIEPKNKELEPGELLKLDIFFVPPLDLLNMVTVLGFVSAVDTMNSLSNSTQIIKRMSLAFLILPLQNYIDNQVVIDFGVIEINGDCNSECVRYLLLCNPFMTKYNWSIKIEPSSRKTIAFQLPLLKGQLSNLDTFPVPLTFKTDVSGAFESKCDIFVDPVDEFSKRIRLASLILKGTAVYSKVYGLPESIEFGSTIVFHLSKRTFSIQNEGSKEVDVNALIRAPFTMKPQKFSIPAKSFQKVEVFFNPIEHKTHNSSIQLFMNQELCVIPISGSGGNSLLKCADYTDHPIDFGLKKDGDIVWTNIFLTNSGTIPLKVVSIGSDTPGKVRLCYIDIVKSAPINEKLQVTIFNKIYVRKDYWKIIRRKIKIFKFMQITAKVFNGKIFSDANESTIQHKKSEVIEILDILNSETPKVGFSWPELSPLHAYQLRVGYPVIYNDEPLRQISLSYKPICEAIESVTEEELIETLTVEMTCEVFVPIEIKPLSLSFGLLPAETFLESNFTKTLPNEYGVSKQTEQTNFRPEINIHVFNNSNTPMSLVLRKISPEFLVSGRSWYILGNEAIEIPVAFHPPREQTQYIGEAIFAHKYDEVTIALTGTGASAELITDEEIDFGNLKLDTSASRWLTLHNRGVLPCNFEMDIVQLDKDFWFKEGDPLEYEAELKSGQSLKKEIICECRKKSGSSGTVVVRWKRVPMGKQEKVVIPLKLLLGYPEFKFETPDVNFKSTYIGINKQIPIRIYNDGYAACNWKASPQVSTLTCDLKSGVLEPGDLIEINIIYSPTQYETLDSSVLFMTDAGLIELLCYGVVGVPYLKINQEFSKMDFGVVTVGQQHHRFLDVTNTGTEPIEYETHWIEMMKDSELCAKEEFDFYYVEPNSAIINPKETLSIKVIVQPKEYAVNYEAEFMIRSFDGEQHMVSLKAIGGLAIVKMTPPKILSGQKVRVSTPLVENVKMKKSVTTDLPVDNGQLTRFLMKSHIDNLYEVVAGIRTAEKDIISASEKMEDNDLYKNLVDTQEYR